MPHKRHKHHPALLQFQKDVQCLQERVDKFKEENITMDSTTKAKFDKLTADVDALIAQHAGGNTEVQAALDALDAKVAAALVAPPA